MPRTMNVSNASGTANAVAAPKLDETVKCVKRSTANTGERKNDGTANSPSASRNTSVVANNTPGRTSGIVIPLKTRSGRADTRAASSTRGLIVRTNVIVASMTAGMNVDASTNTQPGRPNMRCDAT